MHLYKLFALASFLFISSISLFAQIDTSFGSNGIASTQFPPLSSQAEQIMVLPDGKILSAGRAIGSAGYGNAVVAKFLANGQPDLSFGIGGRSVLSGLESVSRIVSLERKADGRILIMGNYLAPGTANSNSFIAQFTADGAEDTTFAANGKLIIDRDLEDENFDLELQPDGKILICGALRRMGNSPIGYISRYTASGSSDITFANGQYIAPLPDSTDYIYRAITQLKAISNNEILYGASDQMPGSRFFAIRKLDGSGTLDTDFGNLGSFVIPDNFTTFFVGMSRFAIITGGKIICTKASGFFIATSNGAFEIEKNLPGILGNGLQVKSFSNGRFVIETSSSFRSPAGNVPSLFLFDSGNAFRGYLKYDLASSSLSFPFDIQQNGRVITGGQDPAGNYALARYLRFDGAGINKDSDFDGDGKTDYSVCRQNATAPRCYLLKPDGSYEIALGSSGTRTMAEDYSGDGRADAYHWIAGANGSNGVFRFARFSPTSSLEFFDRIFGNFLTDSPIGGDYDRNGVSDLAIFRNGTWSIQLSFGNQRIGYQWGLAGDKPVPRDYDGDNQSDIAIYRPSTGQWAILRSSDGIPVITQFGIAEDKPVPGDYDGDLIDDIAVYRPSLGTWFINGSATGFRAIQFGIASDRPVPGDYDGDGKMDAAVFRNGAWYVNGSQDGFIYRQWGIAGDNPLTTAYSAQ